MSRSALFRLNCEIRSKVNTTDDYGQYVSTYVTQSTPRCGMKELTGNEIVSLGLPIHTKAIRVYLEHDVNVSPADQIIIDYVIYEVVYINVLGLRSGLCKGLQVDCKFIGFCENFATTTTAAPTTTTVVPLP